VTTMAAALASALPVDQRWRQVIAGVPRHLFAPDQAWALRGDGPMHPIDAAADNCEWLRQVYAADTAIVIQRDDGALTAGGPGVPTSSLSAPDAVAAFLNLLDVRDGHTVLDIGTGSGWTAGLLSRRVGDANVTTIEADAGLAAQAAANLRSAGLQPAIITGDGSLGFPPRAPYDRIHVTCGVAAIPAAWIEQCRPGGIIVAPWLPAGYPGHQLRLRAGQHGHAAGRFHGTCGYMMMRSQRTRWHAPHAPAARTTRAQVDPRQIAQADPGLHLMIAARMPGVTQIAVPDANGEFSLLLTDNTPQPSWAAADYYPDTAHAQVTQYGTRSLWSETEAAYTAWLHAGSPVQARFGLTITPAGHKLWLDHPRHSITA
jgi:protein-L-isoaspartate O-methyltransferase